MMVDVDDDGPGGSAVLTPGLFRNQREQLRLRKPIATRR
jgi:hypothetical protein